jgi:predicted transcriptional regulator
MPASEPLIPAELLTQFDALSSDAKRWLIGRFIAEDAEDDPELVKSEWTDEIESRIQQIERGEVRMLTPEEVRADVLTALREDRAI